MVTVDWNVVGLHASTLLVLVLCGAGVFFCVLMETRDNGCDETGCETHHFQRGRQLEGTQPHPHDTPLTLVRKLRELGAHVPKAAIWRRCMIAAIIVGVVSGWITLYSPLPMRMIIISGVTFIFMYGSIHYHNVHVGHLAAQNAREAAAMLEQHLAN